MKKLAGSSEFWGAGRKCWHSCRNTELIEYAIFQRIPNFRNCDREATSA